MINFSNYIMLGKVNRYPKRIKLRNTFKKIIKKKLIFFYNFLIFPIEVVLKLY